MSLAPGKDIMNFFWGEGQGPEGGSPPPRPLQLIFREHRHLACAPQATSGSPGILPGPTTGWKPVLPAIGGWGSLRGQETTAPWPPSSGLRLFALRNKEKNRKFFIPFKLISWY